MAKPRVFISSTFYDLKHIRASLEVFVNTLGFDPILFEKGDITFHPDSPLDESCYREAATADIFVLIIGGRYGTAATQQNTGKLAEAVSYESITQREYETAQNKGVPTFILVDGNVASEYRTYLLNQERTDISFAHVEHTNVFKLLKNILEKKQNNPVFNFDRATQIETWLRDQWSGLFRELLNNRSQQRQLSDLNEQVDELRSNNSTLKNYLEEIIRNVVPKESERVIEQEEKKLAIARREAQVRNSAFGKFLLDRGGTVEEVFPLIVSPNSADEAIAQVEHYLSKYSSSGHPLIMRTVFEAQRDYNLARVNAGFAPIDFTLSSFDDARRTAASVKHEQA